MKKTFERLLIELRDNEAQRPLHEKGVRYEDEPKGLRDVLEGKGQELGKDEKDRGIER